MSDETRVTAPPMSDLHERLKAAIEARRDAAMRIMRIAQDNHLMVQEPRLLGRTVPGWHDWPDVEAMAASVERGCLADLRRLERHDEHEGRCTECMEWCDCDRYTTVEQCPCRGNTPWPCPEIRDLADAYGIAEGGDA